MKLLTLLATLAFPSLLFATSNIPAGEGLQGTLGMGWDTDKQKFTGTCLKGSLVRKGKQESNLSFSQTLDQRSMQKELGIDGGTRFRYGEATVKASAKFLKASKSSGFSITSVYSGDYKFKNDILVFPNSDNGEVNEDNILSDTGKLVRHDDTRWQESCGEEYVAQIERGAKLFFSIKIDFMTQEEKDLFETAFSYDSTFASVNAHLKKASKNFSKRTQITVGALQIGGDARRITELFYDNTSTTSESALGFVKCSFGELDKCDEVIANAIRYATKDFKDQLEAKPDAPAYEGGPAELRYLTLPYASAGIYAKYSSVLNGTVIKKRKELENQFDLEVKNLGAVTSILQNEAIILSKRQKDALKLEKDKLDKNIDNLITGAEICHNKIPECPDAANQAFSSMVEFDQRVTVIEPEIFRQYCNIADSPLTTKKLKASMKGMIAAAKELEPEMFQADQNAQVDECLQSDMIFQRNDEINTFSGKEIYILTPLKEYTHWVDLDFSDNKIEDLRPIASWTSLENIDLSENKIRDLEGLDNHESLTHLVISNNLLRDIKPLLSIPYLERVDARNNYKTVSCDGFSDEVTCLSATIRTDAKFVPASTDSIRPLFLPSVVNYNNGEFLVVGGDKGIQNFDVEANAFSMTSYFGNPSHGRVATLLQDGDVLISGGWQSQHTFGVYNKSLDRIHEFNTGMVVPRVGHTATLLNNGKVLLAGGWEGGGSWTGTNASYTAEVFDPETQESTVVGSMHAPRAWHTATLLEDGRVLIVGGYAPAGGLATAEIFDPETMRFDQLKSAMSEGRGAHTATTLPSGKILIAGGFSISSKAVSTAETFNPQNLTFTKVKEVMNNTRGMHSALLLNNGKVLIAGGAASAYAPDHPINFDPKDVVDRGELFDPVENSFVKVPTKMFLPRARHQLVEVKPGHVMVLGGMTWSTSTQMEVFNYIDVNVNKAP